VVAVCGTALSSEQVRAIKREVAPGQASSGQIVLNFDPDAAGARSAEKYISQLLAEGLRVKVLELPGDSDPDEFILREGAEAYAERVARATPYFHWLLDRMRSRFDFETVEGRSDAFRFLLPSIQQVHDPIERSAIASELATYLRVEREVVMRQLKNVSDDGTKATPKRKENNSGASLPPNEVLLLTCFLASGEARDTIRHFLERGEILSALETRKIFECVLNLHAEGKPFSIEAASAHLEPRLHRLLVDIAFSHSAITDESATEQALSCLRALEDKAWQLKCNELRRRIRECEGRGDVQAALTFMTELDKARTQRSSR
jgi:DNA primase